MQSEGRPSSAVAAGSRDVVPHPSLATVGEPGLYRMDSGGGWWVQGCSSSPFGAATPGFASAFPVPQPISRRVAAQVHHGMGTDCEYRGATMAPPTPGRARGIWQFWNEGRPPSKATPRVWPGTRIEAAGGFLYALRAREAPGAPQRDEDHTWEGVSSVTKGRPPMPQVPVHRGLRPLPVPSRERHEGQRRSRGEGQSAPLWCSVRRDHGFFPAPRG